MKQKSYIFIFLALILSLSYCKKKEEKVDCKKLTTNECNTNKSCHWLDCEHTKCGSITDAAPACAEIECYTLTSTETCDAQDRCAWYSCSETCWPKDTATKEACPLTPSNCHSLTTADDCNDYQDICTWFDCSNTCWPKDTVEAKACDLFTYCSEKTTLEGCDNAGYCSWFACNDTCWPFNDDDTETWNVCLNGQHCQDFISENECKAQSESCEWFDCSNSCLPGETSEELACNLKEHCQQFTAVDECDAHGGLCAWYNCSDSCWPYGTEQSVSCPLPKGGCKTFNLEVCSHNNGQCVWSPCDNSCTEIETFPKNCDFDTFCSSVTNTTGTSTTTSTCNSNLACASLSWDTCSVFNYTDDDGNDIYFCGLYVCTESCLSPSLTLDEFLELTASSKLVFTSTETECMVDILCGADSGLGDEMRTEESCKSHADVCKWFPCSDTAVDGLGTCGSKNSIFHCK